MAYFLALALHPDRSHCHDHGADGCDARYTRGRDGAHGERPADWQAAGDNADHLRRWYAAALACTGTRTRSPRPTTTLLAQAANKPDASLVTEFAPFDHRWLLGTARRRPSAVRTSEQRLIFEARVRTAPCTASLVLRERRRSRAVINPSLRASACTTARCVAHSAAAKRLIHCSSSSHSRPRPTLQMRSTATCCSRRRSRGQHEFGFVCALPCIDGRAALRRQPLRSGATVSSMLTARTRRPHSGAPGSGGARFDEATFALIGLLGSVGSVGGNGLYRSRSPARSDAHEHEHVEPTLEANP